MTIAGIGTGSALVGQNAQALVRLQNQVDQLASQLGTGQKSQDFAGLGLQALGARPDRRVERGDIRVTDESARPIPPCGVVETVEQTDRAVAAANAPDSVDRVISGERVEVGAPERIGPSEIAVTLEDVLAHHGLPS